MISRIILALAVVAAAVAGCAADLTYREAYPLNMCSSTAYQVVWGYQTVQGNVSCTTYRNCSYSGGLPFTVLNTCITGQSSYWPANMSSVFPDSNWLRITLSSDYNCQSATGEVWFVQLNKCKTFDGVNSLMVFLNDDKESFTIRNYTGITCSGSPHYENVLITRGQCYLGSNFTTIPLNLNNGGVSYSLLDTSGSTIPPSGAAVGSLGQSFSTIAVALLSTAVATFWLW